MVTENYPQLKSDQNFRDLQAQLEGTENRITVARNRYIQSVQAYNLIIRSFPVNLTAMMFGYKTKANFAVENEAAISKPPSVDFAPPPAPATRRCAHALRQAPEPCAPPVSRQALFLLLGFAVRRRAGRRAAADRASHRSDRHPVRRGGLAYRSQARGARGEKRQPDRGADRADHLTRGHRAIRHPCRGRMEAGTQGG